MDYGKMIEGFYIVDKLDKILDKLEGSFDTVILNTSIKYRRMIRITNNQLTLEKTVFNDSTDIFVYRDGRYLSTSFENLSNYEVDDIANRVLKLFNIESECEEYIPPDLGFETFDVIPGTFNKEVFSDEAVDELLEGILKFRFRNVKRLTGIISVEADKNIILSSYGAKGEYKGSRFVARLRGFRDSLVASTASYLNTKLSVDEVTGKLSEIDEKLKFKGSLPVVEEGKYNVVFAPLAYSNLISYISPMLSAYNYLKDRSVYSGMLGSDVGARIRLVDDTRVESSPYIMTFDNEGFRSEKIEYFRDGVFNDVALNNTLASKMERSNNGRAGIVIPHPSTYLVEHEENVYRGLDELINEVSNGILIDNLWYTRFSNFREGSLSSIQRDIGFYIINGELKTPFYGARVSLNVRDLVEKAMASTESIEWWMGWDTNIPVRTGYVAIENVTVSTGF